MKLPLSWLKDYIDIDLSLEELAQVLTNVGLEVEEITLVGLPQLEGGRRQFKVGGLSWEPDKIVVAQIDEVMPHPNADRLTLCRLRDGTGEYIVLTGAPNLFQYKGIGPLPRPLKVAYAKEGAKIYDGHQPGQVLTTLKRAKIRGVDSFSMVCSEKELGISEEHEGIILLDEDAPTGMPLVEYMGDAVLNISILPNMIRDASVMGVARELSAVTGKPLHLPEAALDAGGPSIAGQAAIEITDPSLNPRFVLGLVRGVEARTSPYKIQRRLRLAGMRPINSIVDATNYVMLATGQPLHAFDYDVLVKRAGGKAPTIITRAAQPGEKLTTLDNVERTLEPYTVLVCDTAGALSLAGVMGGLESEVTESTRTVLLEAASWNFINTRRTATYLHLNSEAGYRFSRGVHPELAPYAEKLGLHLMAQWSGGQMCRDLVDAYPLPVADPKVELTPADTRRILGVSIPAPEIASILERLGFTCQVEGERVTATTPPNRLDIGTGVVGKADLLEEVARIYGYNRIPTTRMADPLPKAHVRPELTLETALRTALTRMGLQEVVNYRLTSPERENLLYPQGLQPADAAYIRLKNPLTPDRAVMRRSLLASVLDSLEKNARLRDRLALFEIGPVFLPREGQLLPDEPQKLAMAITGLRLPPAWDRKENARADFYDLKGIVEGLLEQAHVRQVRFAPAAHPSYHPGMCAEVYAGQTLLGVMGELHPQVKEHYDFMAPPVLAAEFDLQALLQVLTARYETSGVSAYPPVLEDIALIVDEDVPADRIENLIRQTGGKLLAEVRLFDVFRSEQIGAGKKSLAYSLTYQATDRTLNDQEASQLRGRIVRRLENELGAKLRSS
ncbi:MAG: phenylalanine--tRNA ligase subunit beta [Chloroflexi bacterium]|nr:phenylalanine--tRNA ligase subunit beta [Chloroflexota bacterium]